MYNIETLKLNQTQYILQIDLGYVILSYVFILWIYDTVMCRMFNVSCMGQWSFPDIKRSKQNQLLIHDIIQATKCNHVNIL